MTTSKQLQRYQRPELSRESSESESRPSWDCVMDIDIDSELDIDNSTLYPLTLMKDAMPHRSIFSFSPNSTVYCYEVPEGEQQEWYTSADKDLFKAEARLECEVFRRLKKGRFAQGQGELDCSLPQIDLCIVGLEQQLISPEFTRKRVQTKKLVTNAVLMEQARRYGYGDSDSDSDKAERIANAARRYSKWSTKQAKIVGEFQSNLTY